MVREVTVDSIRTPARPSVVSRSYIPVASSSRLPLPARTSSTLKRPVLGESDLDNLAPLITSTSKIKGRIGPAARSRHSQTPKSAKPPAIPRKAYDMELTNTFNFGADDQTMLMDVQPPSSISGLSSPEAPPTARAKDGSSGFVQHSRIGESRMMTPLPSQEMQKIQVPPAPDNTPRVSRLPTPPSSSPEDRSSTTTSSGRVGAGTQDSPEKTTASLSHIERPSPNPRRKKLPKVGASKSGARASLGSPLLPSDRSEAVTPRAAPHTKFSSPAPASARGSKRSSTSYLTPSTLGTPREAKGKQMAAPATAPAGSRKPRQSTSRKSPAKTTTTASTARRRNSTPHASGGRRKSVTPLAMLALSGRKLGFLEERIPIEPGEDPLLLKGPEEDEVCRWPRMSSANRKKLQDMSRGKSGEVEKQAGPSTSRRQTSPASQVVHRHPSTLSPAARSTGSSRVASPQHGLESGPYDFDMGGNDHFDAPDAWDSGASDGEVDKSHVGQDTFLHVLERNGGATSTPRRTAPLDDQNRLFSVSPMTDTGNASGFLEAIMERPAPHTMATDANEMVHEPLPMDVAISPAPSVGQRFPSSPGPSVGQPQEDAMEDASVEDDNETVADDTVIAEEESFFGSSATIVVQEQGGDSLESLEEVESSMLQSNEHGDDAIEGSGKAGHLEDLSTFEDNEPLPKPKMMEDTDALPGLDHTAVADKWETQAPLLDNHMNIIAEVVTPEKLVGIIIPFDDSVDRQAATGQQPDTPEVSFRNDRSLRRSSSRLSFTYELANSSATNDELVAPHESVMDQANDPSLTHSQESVEESVLDIDEPILEEQEVPVHGLDEEHDDVSESEDGNGVDQEEEMMQLNGPEPGIGGDATHDAGEADEDHSTSELNSGDVTMEADSAEWDMSGPSIDSQGSDTSMDVPSTDAVLTPAVEPSTSLEEEVGAVVDVSLDGPQSNGLDDEADVSMEKSAAAVEAMSPPSPGKAMVSMETRGSPTVPTERSDDTELRPLASVTPPTGERPLDDLAAASEPPSQVEERICLKLVHKFNIKVEPTVPPTDPKATTSSTLSDVATTSPNKHPMETVVAPPADSTETTEAPPPPQASAEVEKGVSSASRVDTSFESNTSTASHPAVDTPTPSATAETARPTRPLPPVFRFPRNNSPRGVSTSPIELMHTSRVKQPSRLSQFVIASTSESPEKSVRASVEDERNQSRTSFTPLLGTATPAPEPSAATISLPSTAPPTRVSASKFAPAPTQTSTEVKTTSLGLLGMDPNRSSSSSGGSSGRPAHSAASSSFRSLADEMATSSFGGMSSWHTFDGSLIEVSSLDPRAAARAAAILKMNHAYIQDGILPSTPSAASIPLPMTPSTVGSTRSRRRTPRPFESPYFETIELSRHLTEEELLHEAELEIVASHRHRPWSRGQSQGRGDGYSSDGTEINLPGGWLSSAKKRKRSMSTARPSEPEASPAISQGQPVRPWGVREWKKLEKVYRSERTRWSLEQDVARSPSTSWLSWATCKLSTSMSSSSEDWDAERVVKRFIETEKAQGGVGEWAEHVIRLRVRALEKRVNRKVNGRPNDGDEHDRKRRRIDVHTPNDASEAETTQPVAPPSTIQRMLSSIWSSTSSSSLAETSIPPTNLSMPSSQSLRAVTLAFEETVRPPLPEPQAGPSSESAGPAMRQVGNASASMTTPLKFQPAHPSSPAWSPALPVPGAMPRSPHRRPPPLNLQTPAPVPGSSVCIAGPSWPSTSSAVAHTPVSLHAPSSTPKTRTKPLYPPLYPALSKRSESIRTLFETPGSSRPTSDAAVPIAIPRGRNPSPSVKELARSFEDDGVLNRLYKGKEKEKESALRRVHSREL